MRKDCTIDNVRVHCPNASHIADGKWFCKRGDVFSYYQEGDIPHGPARSLGRVRADGKTYILALVMSEVGDSAYERWIDPLDVTRISSAPVAFPKFFFSRRLPKSEIVRKLCEHGTLSERYIHNVKQRIAEFTDV